MRISASVDAQRMDEARHLSGATGSRLFDLALAALVERLQAERETAVLAEHPYDADPEVAWHAPQGPDLPYDGDIPADVRVLAARRRRAESDS